MTSAHRLLASLAGALLLFFTTSDRSELAAQTQRFGLVIHGGANSRTPGDLPAEREREYLAALEQALEAGFAILERGGRGVEAVEAAIRVMEDSPLFNAGKGAAPTHTGTYELDASIMDGGTFAAGGVAGVRNIRNPISLARLVMEASPHVLLVGDGAVAFGLEHGAGWVTQDYFYTDERWEALMRRQEAGAAFGTTLPGEYRERPDQPRPDNQASAARLLDDGLHGTVGAAALDRSGALAAGTSTGGRIDKRPGRVGDSPLIGAGTYANPIVAASVTGLGENHMRILTTKELSVLMEYKGLPLEKAADVVMREQLHALGGTGGLIAIDKDGNIAMPFTTAGMARGYALGDGTVVVKLYED